MQSARKQSQRLGQYRGREATDRTKKTVPAFHDLGAGTEEQEGPRSVRAFGFALVQTFVTNQGTLLVSNQTADRDASQRTVCNASVYLGRRDESWQNRGSQAKEFQQRWLPLQGSRVQQKGARGVRDF